MKKLLSAVFDSPEQAKTAVESLGAAGVPSSAINYADAEAPVIETSDTVLVPDPNADAADVLAGVSKGTAIGALLGVAALAIPVIGPVVAGAALASTVGGVALTGGLLGGSIGAISEALQGYDYKEEEISFVKENLERGGILITVNTTQTAIDPQEVERIFAESGGKLPATEPTERQPDRETTIIRA